jgi:cell division protease FtsH
MEQAKATTAAELGVRPDSFRTLAEDHRKTVKAIRERNRQRRLGYLLGLNLIIFAYLLKRLLEDRPLNFGFPQLGPDAAMWLLPLGLILMMGLAVMLPLANGRSPHVRFSPDQIGIDFKDVRGIDLVLEEVTRTLQIFLAYKTFKEELGGNPRRGVLFEGTPGTGKTHLAKAMAAEAEVPFYYVSAPAFQSQWYGATAWKIRAYFKTLKKAARKEGGAIGFIEEIDAIGGVRGGMESFAPMTNPATAVNKAATQSTGNSGMVNELLIQLQSFDTPPLSGRMGNKVKDFFNLFLPADHQIKKGRIKYNNVLIIAATNRADSLDPALLRPGRFDRILHFDLPSRKGRRDLVDYFLEKRVHSNEMERDDLREEFASMTLGYTPAMLEHVLDEALVWAIRDGRRELNWRDIQRARLTEEIGLGQPVAYTTEERDLIATHEAGHAVAAYLCAKDRKLEVLSIIKRRTALGLLAHSDTEERFTKKRSELEALIKVALGGMASEHIYFGEHGTGPSSDLSAATALVAQMVGSYGMGSSLISYEAVDNGAHSTPNIVAKVLTNDDTRRETEEILKLHKDQVTDLLHKNKHLVEALRDALLEREELIGDEIMTVIEKAEIAHEGSGSGSAIWN